MMMVMIVVLDGSDDGEFMVVLTLTHCLIV
jgi:hypothetical protein